MDYTSTEMMTIVAARALKNEDICFVGIGLPSAACNLARITHAPDITLIYESGTIGCRPDVLPLSIGDGDLCETALTTVSVPEIFRYWLQGGRITVGFLSAAQLDRFGNINTTVIGDYQAPRIRLPGSGGAPEIAALCREYFIIMKQSRRGFVKKLDFTTSLGHGFDNQSRRDFALQTKGPTRLVTDLCIMEPDPESGELRVTSIHPGITLDDIQARTAWTVGYAQQVVETVPPRPEELEALRDLNERTRKAHLR